MNSRLWATCTALTVLLGFGLSAGAAQGSELQLEGTPASVAGTHDTVVAPGAVHLHEGALESLTLSAERIQTDFSWKRWTVVEGAAGPELLGAKTDEGQSSPRYENASISLQAKEGQTEVLAFPGNGSPKIEAEGVGDYSLDRFDDTYLNRIGQSPQREDTGGMDSIGFWYGPPVSWMLGAGSDRAVVEGNFSLLVNNVTVTIHEEGERAWSNWTGYREDRQAPGVHSYERHLLLLHVTNGTLTLAGEDGVSVLGPRLSVDVDGVVTAGSATGRVQLADTTVAFERDPLWMEGDGRLHLSEAGADLEEQKGLAMEVEGISSFEVEGGERASPSSTPFSGTSEGGMWGLVLGLALASVVVGAHQVGVGGQLLDRWRTSRYTKWMTRGRELANAADYGQAASCFRRAARAQPDKGVAWYHLAISLLEDERPREVLDVVDEAREGEAIIDELDFLEVEAEAARRVGDAARCREAVRQLADGSEAMASSLARDLELDENVLGEELAGRLSPGGDEGELPGYV